MEEDTNQAWLRVKEEMVHLERLATLGQLSAGIVHELRNPLNFITNFAKTSVELLSELDEILTPNLENLEPEARETVRELLDNLQADFQSIVKHGDRADSVINSTLLLSRKEGGSLVETNLNQLLQDALGLAVKGSRVADPTFHVELETQYDPTLQPVPAAPQDLIRVFINLISNALYAAKKRKDQNENAGYQPTLQVTTGAAQNGVEIRIRDNGTGIPPEVVQNLFQPFFTTKPVGEGTGLGLSISHEIITTQHGGRIEVDSMEGEYTEFLVWLPIR